MYRIAIAAAVSLCLLTSAFAESNDDTTSYTRQKDVVYKRTYGTALTMDIFTPKHNAHANGATVIWVLSGGWYSGHDRTNPVNPDSPIIKLTDRGYKVAAVVHGSNPLFTIEDAISDIERAVRFVRYHNRQEGYTSTPIGIIGGSAGGHLSLMAGTTGDDGDKDAKDPIDRMPSRVDAVACFYPPTDFLNYGKPGQDGTETILKKGFTAPFQFREYIEETKTLERITDKNRRRELIAQVSPITHVTPDDAPAMIIHGDADALVPYQQSEIFTEKMKEAGVETELVNRPGKAHGWPNMAKDYELLYDFLDKHLAPKTATAQE